jgi:hypothetical protein
MHEETGWIRVLAPSPDDGPMHVELVLSAQNGVNTIEVSVTSGMCVAAACWTQKGCVPLCDSGPVEGHGLEDNTASRMLWSCGNQHDWTSCIPYKTMKRLLGCLLPAGGRCGRHVAHHAQHRHMPLLHRAQTVRHRVPQAIHGTAKVVC